MPRLVPRLLAVGLLAAACSNGSASGPSSEPSSGLPVATVELRQGSATLRIRAEVAATSAARRTGLMHRVKLDADAGMLFVFPAAGRGGFYMKNTLIPLDIAFIRAGMVIGIYSMTPCAAEPCPETRPVEDYDRALEVNAGAFARAGISPGATVLVSGLPPGGG